MLNLHGSRALLSFAASPILVAGLFAGFFADDRETASVAPAAVAGPDANAQETTTFLANALIAAVANISDAVPAGTAPAQILSASAAVSALLPEAEPIYRLIDASGSPLDGKNLPKGPFEVQGMVQLAGGAASVQKQGSAFLRTLLPLTNDMHPNCMTCHANYAALPPGTLVGAASFRVRI
ncbi:MAG: hypothetical protein AAF628_06800 [Planctomycetota bacterium]